MTKLYFVHERTKTKFQIISLDKDTGKITLKGEHSTFTYDFDKAEFKRLGYRLIQEEEADA